MGDAPASSRAMSNLAVRLLTAVVVVPVLLYLMFWAPKWGFPGLVMIAIGVGALELGAMTTPSRVQRAFILVATLGVGALLVYAPDSALAIPAVVGLTVGALLIALAAPDPMDTAGARMAWSIAGPLYVGGMLSTLALLHARESGGAWVMLAMCLAWLADTGGYFAGRAFGKHKLYEKISPKKTVEGAIGGLAGATAGAVFASEVMLDGFPLGHAIGLGLAGGAIGMAGDLFESLLKRSAGVKDSGWIVPGHGGLLDRVDALMFTSTLTWAYATFLYPG
jgi:phosphatidate cytidylyltransferase